jgi:alpha-mannosidase
MLETVKKSEEGDDVVLRLYEFWNARGKARVKLSFNVKSVESVDILESNSVERDISISRTALDFTYRNREIITLKIRR